jgi:hypothetical protein
MSILCPSAPQIREAKLINDADFIGTRWKDTSCSVPDIAEMCPRRFQVDSDVPNKYLRRVTATFSSAAVT